MFNKKSYILKQTCSFHQHVCLSMYKPCSGQRTFNESRHRKCSIKKGVLKNFLKISCEKGLQHRWFPVKFAKFLWTPILKKTCEQLLLSEGLYSFFLSETRCWLGSQYFSYKVFNLFTLMFLFLVSMEWLTLKYFVFRYTSPYSIMFY